MWVPREQRPLLPTATHIQGSLPALPGQGAGCGRRPGREGQAGRVTGSPPEVAGVLPPLDRQGPQGCSLAGTAGVRQEGLHLLGLGKLWGAGPWWWPQLPGAPVAGPGSPSEPEHAPVPTALLAQSGLLATRLLSDPVTCQFGRSAQPGRGARRAGCCCPLVAAAGRALRLGRAGPQASQVGRPAVGPLPRAPGPCCTGAVGRPRVRGAPRRPGGAGPAARARRPFHGCPNLKLRHTAGIRPCSIFYFYLPSLAPPPVKPGS